MFQVEWRPPAVDELAEYWISADAPTRAMLTAAAAEIGRKLSDNPHAVGESRVNVLRDCQVRFLR